MKKHLTTVVLFFFFAFNIEAQHKAYGVKGGFTLGMQKSLFPLLSYHIDGLFEFQGRWTDKKGTGKFSRIGIVTQLGYHRKGASYTNGRIFGTGINVIPVEDVFHNLSLSLLLKGAYKFGNFAPYFMVGLRGDATLYAELVALSQQGNNLAPPQVNVVNFGFFLGGGVDWEPPKLPFGIFLELNISPDITPQVIKHYQQVFDYNTSRYSVVPLNPPEKTINFVLEISAGIKFIQRKHKEPVEEM